MAETEDKGAEPAEKPKPASKLPVILGLVLFVVLGAGGFLAVQKGLIPGIGPEVPAGALAEAGVPAMPDISYVKITPLIINLGSAADARLLRFRAEIEVNGSYAEDVTRLLPRIVDVLNGYLRAVDLRDLEDRSALVRLRAQMLRRVQLVAGTGRVRDLLITEFVVN
ncbi:flagellar basal body-associated FliL family protein [Frigidibacter sp. ROC022]|uniref:flagellar basal body-associated FliL family protein n=1 Tax=Frigidibacter sp. ROC022 TaxID=2971796 RepID=UPI00215AD45E|nr:flagellar basal body-associated FliL family protein [Frigidibacter sp. ROC022]MCR8724354.1 flagellar basal body-associated FliL family protein [Frigidibacter sp. ROC022]